MKYFFSLTLFAFLSLFLIQCNTNSNGLTISGEIANASNLNVYLDKMTFSNSFERVAQATADASGDFKITTEEAIPEGQYRLRLGSKSVDLVLAKEDASINITGDLNTIQNMEYTLTGSAGSSYYQDAVSKLLKRQLDNAKAQKLVDESPTAPLAAALASKLYTFQPNALPVHKKVQERLLAEMPDADITTEYGKQIASLEAKSKTATNKKYAVNVGDPAPEIALPGLDGKIQKLSDQKGKVVLLDFWASWCGPCRKANPHVVETYEKYKDQGFTVFSVSLDGLDTRTKSRLGSQENIDKKMASSKQRWEAAIKKDQLTWNTHVSDLKKWESEGSKAYGVSSIPTTFLVGRDGNIAALNPRYNLEEEIKKAL